MMRRIGSSLLLALAVLAPPMGAAKKKPAVESYALVAGTVFREPGFALPGVEVTVASNPEEGQPAGKIKKLQAFSDSRGEFAFRVPPTPMRYTVKASAKGYRGEEKTVSVQGEERVDVTFTLRQESNE